MNSRSNASWSCCPGIKEAAEASRLQGASFRNYFFPRPPNPGIHGAYDFLRRAPRPLGLICRTVPGSELRCCRTCAIADVKICRVGVLDRVLRGVSADKGRFQGMCEVRSEGR